MNESLGLLIPLLVGFFLDLLIGDPLCLPHPIRLFGKVILFWERILNIQGWLKIKGVVMTISLISIIWILLYYLQVVFSDYQIIYIVFSSVCVFYCLANRSLITEVLKVEYLLTNKGIEAGRNQLSFIVGRETTHLTENKIRIAALETLSENLSDGVVAPLFYYAIGGIPLMFAYKMINTLDSMIGYKNEKYKKFGWFAAKLDDVTNFIPARITALLMVLVSLSGRGLQFIFLYGNKHLSPNSGYPEAALAGILNCRFGGANTYHGKIIEKEYIGKTDRIIIKKDVFKACYINIMVSIVTLGLIMLYFFNL